MSAADQPGPAAGHGPERLAILGATGGIGGHLLNWAVDAGYPVHVLARRPEVVPGRPGVTVTGGDATDPGAVADVVASADAVLSALGSRGAKTPGLLGTAASAVTQAMVKHGVHRLICVSAAGAFIREDPEANPLVKVILPSSSPGPSPTSGRWSGWCGPARATGRWSGPPAWWTGRAGVSSGSATGTRRRA